MKKFYFAIMFLFILGLSNYSETRAQKVSENDKSALLYEITGKDLQKPSYIFGTIHLICPKDMIPIEKLDPYLSKSEQVVMEIDLDNQTEIFAFTKSTQLPEGISLETLLTKEQFTKVDQMTREFFSTPLENLKTRHPIFFQSMLYSNPKAIGCATPGSYEISLFQYSISKGKPIQGLETVAMQMETLNKTPLKTQAEGLYKIALDPEKFFTNFKKLIEIYKTQNSDDIFKFAKTQNDNNQNFQKTLLDNRNQDWIPKIEKKIKEKTSFIAVGAAHLGGEKGVLKLLKAKGYKLKPIRL